MLHDQSPKPAANISLSRNRHASHQGIALILVLAFLVIISGLTLAFFSSISTESSGASAAAASASAQTLSDSAVNVVMAQIIDATKGRTDESDPSSAQAWASQPGMIRTYSTAGEPLHSYKLYSDSNMIETGPPSNTGAASLANWNAPEMEGIYTDLNAPAVDAQGELIYPIMDPRAEVDPQLGRIVEGFSIAERPGFDSSKDPSATNNNAPMPVKWLYMLEDGTLVPPSGKPDGDGAVEIPGASSEPGKRIKGRVAFWTDDESTKVNINTASEGVYWDIPRINSLEDVGMFGGGLTAAQPGLALCQPASNEYQRYPGHPATTSLSPIFQSLLPLPPRITRANSAQVDKYYALAPRIVPGGSFSGTAVPANSGKLIPDADRLYASIDELMFQPEMGPSQDGIQNRLTNESNTSRPENFRETLERTKFFITASSSAPEVTLYNTPRIGIWPVNTVEQRRTAFDKLAAFCATIGGKEYYFSRNNPRSKTADYDGIPRNQVLYKSLQTLTSRPVPGFGGSFLQKYAQDRDQILTSIFDYIRCVNLADTSPGAVPYTPISTFKVAQPGGGEVIPIQIGNTQGFGRYDTIAEAALLFHGVAGPGQGQRATRMRAVLLMEFASPMQGNVGYQPNLKHRITGLNDITVRVGNSQPSTAYLPPRGENFIEVPGVQTWHGRGVGGTEGMNMAFMNRKFDQNSSKRLHVSGGTFRGNYPFFSGQDINLAGATTDSFELCPNGPVEVTVEILTADTNELVQTLKLEFPRAQLRIPRTPHPNDMQFSNRLSGGLMGGEWDRLVRGEDTVVSLEPAGVRGNDPRPGNDATAGDIRMIAGRSLVEKRFFRAHNTFMINSTTPTGKSYGMMSALGLRYPGATVGKLVPVPSYQNGGDRQTDVPTRVGNYVTRADDVPGDWDTGFAAHKDGAYINKPDEGDQQFVNLWDGGRRIPYMVKEDYFEGVGRTYFSPNRQIPSALMFGSIPTGVQRFQPWQTLLFHPAPEDPTHPGKETVPDHLLADLFWMPVVEPYAISQPFSTAGKINMNYQIQPFTYIQRDTGMRAVMKSTKFLALRLGDGVVYKPHITSDTQPPTIPNRRLEIDLTETLKAFETKFANNELFKSATEICEMNLVPPGQRQSTMAQFWGDAKNPNPNSHRLTGDNLREKPYVDIYPRLTTKSNAYTVHVRVQTIKKSKNTPADRWVTGKDQVAAEYRGSSTIERYIDVNDPKLPDFASLIVSNPSSPELNIDKYYRFRVVNTKRFAP